MEAVNQVAGANEQGLTQRTKVEVRPVCQHCGGRESQVTHVYRLKDGRRRRRRTCNRCNLPFYTMQQPEIVQSN